MKLWLLFLSVCALALLSLGFGEQRIAPAAVIEALRGEGPAATRMIVLDLRLPRMALALLSGAALGLAGALAQGALRNPLAEPGLLGVNGGAALAVLAILSLRPDLAGLAPLAAFCGALAIAGLILGLSLLAGVGPERVIMIGLACGALTSAAAGFLSAFGELVAIQRAMIWMSGSLQGAGWPAVRLLALCLIPALAAALLAARALDVLRLGPEVATGLGLRPKPALALTLGLCAALSGAVVAAAGPIAFAGLIAPHVARRITGAGHARLIPAASLTGAGLLILADALGRTLIAPAQIPAGIACALLGGPLFAALLLRRP